MRKTFILCFVVLAASLSLTGCSALKNFLSRDLEDEDFIIGQLYVDEVVKETPVIAQRVEPRSSSKSNPLGLSYSAEDNHALYETVNSWLGVPYKYGGTDRNGDILFFTNSKGKVSHVGIYLKEGLFAHASTSNGVSVSRLDDTYWTKHFYKGGRIKK